MFLHIKYSKQFLNIQKSFKIFFSASDGIRTHTSQIKSLERSTINATEAGARFLYEVCNHSFTDGTVARKPPAREKCWDGRSRTDMQPATLSTTYKIGAIHPNINNLIAVHAGIEPASHDRQSQSITTNPNGPIICHLSDP